MGNYGSRTVLLQAGVPAPPQERLDLGLGSIGINSLQVWNSSGCFVAVYNGMSSPQGQPNKIVPPYTSSTFLVSNSQYVAVAINGTPAVATDYVDLAWTDEQLVSLTTPTGTAPIARSSTPWFASIAGVYTTPNQSVNLFNASAISFNTGFFLTDLVSWGFDRQKIGWAVSSSFFPRLNPFQLQGFGEIDFHPTTPLALETIALSNNAANVALSLNPSNFAVGVKTPFAIYAGGYFV